MRKFDIKKAPTEKSALSSLANHFDFDGIGISLLTIDRTTGKQNVIAGLKAQYLLGGLGSIVEHNVHTGELFRHNRGNAPAHGQSTPDLGIRCHTNNIHRGTEAADKHCSLAGNRTNNNCLGIHVQSHGTNRMGNAVQIILAFR